MNLEETLFVWLIGFIVGYLSKKTNYIINLNFKENGTSNEL